MILWPWLVFLVLITFFLFVDLGIVNRRPHAISFLESIIWTAIWIVLALMFGLAVYYLYEYNVFQVGITDVRLLTGRQAFLQYITGYLIEKSLSLDNIFVIALIFTYFGIELKYQHRILFWGIFGAIVLRGIFIFLGIALLNRLGWMVYVFGGLLILSAVKILISRNDTVVPSRNPLVRLTARRFPLAEDYSGERFFIIRDGRRLATPLLLALLMVESSDVLFAVDSIPAIFAVTRDPFLILTANVFALLGLRSLYFALASALHRFRYLKFSLTFILVYVGMKMILSHHFVIPTWISLVILLGALLVGILASLADRSGASPGLESPLADRVIVLADLAYHQVRRIVILAVGSSFLLLGLVMIVLPGPATVMIPLGLAILATEFVWARIFLKRIKSEGLKIQRKASGLFSRKTPG